MTEMVTSATRIERVIWWDSCSVSGAAVSGGGWNSPQSVMQGPLRIESTGWVVRETETFIVLVSHVSPTEMAGDMSIPKTSIIERSCLRIDGSDDG